MIEDVDNSGDWSADEPCIGTSSSGHRIPGTEKIIYSAGLEFAQFRVHHSISNPWDAEKKAHCVTPGAMAMAPIKGACADYIMDDAIDSSATKWTDGDLKDSMSGDGTVTGHG